MPSISSRSQQREAPARNGHRSPEVRPAAEGAKRRDYYLYYNGHGDLAAEADGSGTRTALHTYTPFGAPNDAPPTNSAVHRYTGAWSKQLDTTSSLILMGARPYDPSLGRFLAVDPIDGGSLNNYDYAGQDPVDNYDLTGTVNDYDLDQEGNTYVTGAFWREQTACDSSNVVAAYYACQQFAKDYSERNPTKELKNDLRQLKSWAHKHHRAIACGVFVMGFALGIGDIPMGILDATKVVTMTVKGLQRAKELAKIGALGTASGLAMAGGLTYGCTPL